MSDTTSTIPRCGYCGNHHNYSQDMCKDMMVRGCFVQITNIPNTEQDIRADERRLLRKGARERVVEAMTEAAAKDASYTWRELAKAAVAAVFGETP